MWKRHGCISMQFRPSQVFVGAEQTMQQLARRSQGPLSLRGRTTRPRSKIVVSDSSSTTSGPSTSERTQDQEIAAAWSLLTAFTELDFKGRAHQQLKDAANRSRLREAFMLAYGHPYPEESWMPSSSPEVLLGVVASEARLAVRALRDWCQALGLQYVTPDCKVAGAASLAAVQGAVYIKYNSSSKVCYLSQYKGTDRGVLVQLGPGRLLGHFPLGMWDEGMNNPEPQMNQHHPHHLQQQQQQQALANQQQQQAVSNQQHVNTPAPLAPPPSSSSPPAAAVSDAPAGE